jgi:hypothetical protein
MTIKEAGWRWRWRWRWRRVEVVRLRLLVMDGWMDGWAEASAVEASHGRRMHEGDVSKFAF